MLPQNIDLTENGDFRGGQPSAFIGFDTLIGTWYYNEYMTPEQYDAIMRLEEVFGRRRHDNSKRIVFGMDDIEYEKSLRHSCLRCGKEFHVPWNSIYGLCRECNEHVEGIFQGNVPWKANNMKFGSQDRTKEVFSLR